MTEIREIYKCNVCGNVIEVVHPGAPALVCCEQPMEKLVPKTEDAGGEKHVPVISKEGEGIRVKVGSVLHPMEEKHYIKFIEVLLKDRVIRKELSLTDSPEGVFALNPDEVAGVREFCNIHGLWENKQKGE